MKDGQIMTRTVGKVSFIKRENNTELLHKSSHRLCVQVNNTKEEKQKQFQNNDVTPSGDQQHLSLPNFVSNNKEMKEMTANLTS